MVHGRRAAQPVPERLAASGRQVIQELAERPGMGAVQPGYLLVRAGRGEDFGSTPRTLAALRSARGGDRAEHTALATAHLVQAVAQVLAI